MQIHRLVSFAAMAFVLIIVPGPSVLFVVSRALASGRAAAVATVCGNAIGVVVQSILVAVGLGSVVRSWPGALDWISVLGGGYLIYLGIKALMVRTERSEDAPTGDARVRWPTAVRDGFVVGSTNPKALMFFAAVLPQFVDPDAGHIAMQMVVLGVTFAAIALVCDAAWGLLAGSARAWFGRAPRRVQIMRMAGGIVMVGLGCRVWWGLL